jgi:hypothetical protein
LFTEYARHLLLGGQKREEQKFSKEFRSYWRSAMDHRRWKKVHPILGEMSLYRYN